MQHRTDRRPSTTTGAMAAGAAIVVLIGACAGYGTEPADPPEASEQYGASATILQQGDGEPQLCLGPVGMSLPPACGGPEVVGLDWDELDEVAREHGATWWSGYVVGSWDGERFTLSRTPTTDPPDGMPEPGAADQVADLPALCEDPWRGGEPDGGPRGQDHEDSRAALDRVASDLPGFVMLYVSDGQDEFNVVVTSDAEGAHETLREVWPGWLCVAERELVPAADVLAAQEAVTAIGDEIGLLMAGGIGSGDGLHLQVLVEDDATRDAILDAVEPWLTEDQVTVEPALQPLPG